MSTLGDRIGKFTRSQLGVGVQIPPEAVPQDQDVVYSKFSAGLDLSDSPEGLELDRASYVVDMEVTRDDRLIKAPGIARVREVGEHSLLHIFEQSSIDYATELVAIDPPFVGIKNIGNFIWTNRGIAATNAYGWAVANALGTVLFSNGFDKTYTRDFNGITTTDISDQIIAAAFATSFGRVFAGAYVANGSRQALGIAWNAATGAINDWAGAGAGAELLIGDTDSADKIVGLRGIGFDTLGILCRNSLWVGYPTHGFDRPADFRQRFNGVGAVTRESIASTPGGVTFLTDEGVANFDANNVSIISGPINPELLPLDYAGRYVGTYHKIFQRYILATPKCVWIYEFPIAGVREGRWLKRSAIVDNVLKFTKQVGPNSWDSAVGSWDSQTALWGTVVQSQSNSISEVHFTKGKRLGKEDQLVDTNFGLPMGAMYRTPFSSKARQTDVFTTKGFEIEYVSAGAAVIEIATPDMSGNFNNVVSRALPSTGGRYARTVINGETTGQGIAAEIRITQGNPMIAHIRHIFMPSGPGVVTL